MSLIFSRNKDGELESVNERQAIVSSNVPRSELSECLQIANKENLQVHYVMQPDECYTVTFRRKK